MENSEFRAKVIAKAWKDPTYKKKLFSQPKEAFKEVGQEIPNHVNVKVIEDPANTFTFVLPPKPVKTEELSETELLNMAGGSVCSIMGCG